MSDRYFIKLTLLIIAYINICYASMNWYIDGDREYIGSGLNIYKDKIGLNIGFQFNFEYDLTFDYLNGSVLPYLGLFIQKNIVKEWNIKGNVNIMTRKYYNEIELNNYILRTSIELIYKDAKYPIGFAFDNMLINSNRIRIKPRIIVYF